MRRHEVIFGPGNIGRRIVRWIDGGGISTGNKGVTTAAQQKRASAASKRAEKLASIESRRVHLVARRIHIIRISHARRTFAPVFRLQTEMCATLSTDPGSKQQAGAAAP
jgi:hypothetical protein